MNENQNLPKFIAIESIPATKRNFLFKFIFSVMILAILGIFIMSVYCLIFEKTKGFYIFILLISGIICFGFGKYFYANYPIYISFLIDELGLHKIASGKKTGTKSILYKDLINPEHALQPRKSYYGLFLKIGSGRYSKNFLEVYSLDTNNTIITTNESFKGNLGPNVIFRNRRKLIARFLLRVSHFSPDILIDPMVFAVYFINPKTFEYDTKAQSDALVFVLLLVMAIVLVLCGVIIYLDF